MNDTMTRRVVILRALQLPLSGAILFGLSGCGADKASSKNAAICADPQTLTTSEASMRTSLSYVETSPNLQQTCSGCAFFQASTGSCGTCQMFDGGSVNAQGHCSSWSAKS